MKRKPDMQAKTGRKPNGQFAAGSSGNPAGRPPSRKYLSEALREWLAAPSEIDPQATNADILAAAVGKAALEGNIAAIEIVADRTEGKAPSKLDLKVEDNRDDERLRQSALKLFEQYRAVVGDEQKAKELLAEDAPTLSKYVH
jgi:uncharacterized protein DUF5681